MKSKYLPVSLVGCLALGLAAAGCSGGSESATDEAQSSQSSAADVSQSQSNTATQAPSPDAQKAIAQATLQLENEFSDQFTRGQIDRTALQGAIDDVVQAMPEAARAKVQQHIDDMINQGEKLASQLTPAQRAAIATPPSNSNLDQVRVGIITGWGYPGAVGWGGYGAFGFPGMWGHAYGYGPYFGGYYHHRRYGYGYGYGNYLPVYGYGYGCGAWGCNGLGNIGWYW